MSTEPALHAITLPHPQENVNLLMQEVPVFSHVYAIKTAYMPL
jgi:hypothetical protein